ncbi:unnamed protein product [Withania somnifera]
MKSYSNSEKPMSTGEETSRRLLITVNVLGSAGPLRFVVDDKDKVARVGRLPLMSSDINDFFLYSATAGVEALGPSELIGSLGVRNFILCKKQKQPWMTEGRAHGIAQNGKKGWKAWLTKSFSFKIHSH